jgi:plasmid stability protein
MASGTVAVRLPDEVLEELQKRAAAENKKVSDLVRELIVSGMADKGATTNDTNNAKVIEYLEGFGGVLMAVLYQSVGARYFAEMATSYGVDMESLMREAKPMNREQKEALMKRFEEAAIHAAQAAWAQVLGMEKQTGGAEIP